MVPFEQQLAGSTRFFSTIHSNTRTHLNTFTCINYCRKVSTQNPFCYATQQWNQNDGRSVNAKTYSWDSTCNACDKSCLGTSFYTFCNRSAIANIRLSHQKKITQCLTYNEILTPTSCHVMLIEEENPTISTILCLGPSLIDWNFVVFAFDDGWDEQRCSYGFMLRR